MKTFDCLLAVMVAAICATTTQAAIITRTTTNNTVSAGQTTLTQAIQMLHDGDTISFNVPGATGQAQYFPTPNGGYPIITNNNVTIDGYSQPGASANTNS